MRAYLFFGWMAGLLLVMPLDARGQSAGVFSRIGFGARGLALGNALVADALDNGSPYYNPAHAPNASGQSLEASAAMMSFDRELQFLQFSTPLEPSAGIAAGLIHAGVSNIDGRDNSGYHTGNYSTDEYAAFLAFGTRLSEEASVGIGLQLFRSDMHEDLEAVHTLGIDIGFTYAVRSNLRLGVTLDDLLAKYSWDTSGLYGSSGRTTSDPFPVRLRIGAAYELMDGRAQVLAEYESRFTTSEFRTRTVQLVGDRPQEVEDAQESTIYGARFRAGGEYLLSDVFTLRGGIDRIGDSTLGGIAPSGGFMVEQPVGPLGLRGEYAFLLEPYGTGPMHLITLRVFL